MPDLFLWNVDEKKAKFVEGIANLSMPVFYPSTVLINQIIC